ncbi:class I SAM-dependent methyltransferase [Arthrobacter sp. 260]|uniref:class I SAM-dependent methyltransferase n=1 Tax=Arthrobacter sp. 260 TaxID=2735314 RepID=UPI001E48F9D6|nr:class I SAM-dependent methyltransferase [Arthrobacter sp. 260]
MSEASQQSQDHEHTTPTAETMAQRVLDASLGMVDALAIHLGDRLGWYRQLRDGGPATAAELAQRSGTNERYTREWLEQQAVTGILAVAPGPVDGVDAAARERKFSIPPGAAEVLTDEGSLNYLAPLARMFAGAAVQLPSLLHAYRTGGGVGWSDFGADARESQADMNRPWFESALPGALEGIEHLDAQLRRPGARIADVGAGGGWSSIALARTYPNATVEGFDVDPASVKLATANAAHAGVQDRVIFWEADAKVIPAASYDAVFAFECIHDLPHPVEVLAAARQALAPHGTVIVMDEAVADTFTAPGDELERLMYGFSLLICLPDGMSHPLSTATGTVMRPDVLHAYAVAAGFSDIRTLPIENFGFWRFYELLR